METGWGFGFQSSNQSSPEVGAAIHSFTLIEFAFATAAGMLAPLGVGMVSVQLPVPLGTRLMEKSTAWRPYVTAFNSAPPPRSKRYTLPPSALMLNPVFVADAGDEPSHRNRR